MRSMGAVLGTLVLLTACSVAGPAASPAASAAASAAASPRPISVKLGESGIAIDEVLDWVALDLGLFDKQGLQVEIVTTQGGTQSVQSLVSDSLQVALVGGPTVAQADQAGTGILMIGASMLTYPYYVVVGKDIVDAAALKGKSFAISRLGSASDFAARVALQGMGLKRSDVTIVQAGGTTARLTAVISGAVAATLITPELRAQAEKAGLHVLFDLATANTEYANSVYAASSTYLKANPDFAARFRAALSAAELAVRDSSKAAEVKAIIAKRYKLEASSDTVASGYQYLQTKSSLILPKDALLTRKAVDAVATEAAGTKKPLSAGALTYEGSVSR